MTQTRFLKLMGISLLLLYGLSFFESSASSNISNKGNLSEKKLFNHQAQPRSYRIYTPETQSKKPLAAVLLLHGHGGSADQLLGVRGQKAPYRLWMPIADREGLLLIIPDGLVSPDGKQGWNDARNISTNPDSDDVDFLNTLVETVAETYPIDFNRVYATGISNGGHMALRLAAETPEKFAAVAAVAAANPEPIFARKPQNFISVLLMNGTNDRFLPYEGGKMIRGRGAVQSTDDSIKYWVKHNQCEERPHTIQYANRSRTDVSTASRTTYRNIKTNVEVANIQILGGGHAEPSIEQPYSRLILALLGAQNRDIEMADEIWQFFEGKSASPTSIP